MKTQKVPFNLFAFINQYETSNPKPEIIWSERKYRAMKNGIIKTFDSKKEALQYSLLVESYISNEEEQKESLNQLDIWQKEFNKTLNKTRIEYYNLNDIVFNLLDSTADKITYENSISEDKESVFFELYQLYNKLNISQ